MKPCYWLLVAGASLLALACSGDAKPTAAPTFVADLDTTVVATPTAPPTYTPTPTPAATPRFQREGTVIPKRTPVPTATPSPTATRAPSDPSGGATLMRLVAKVSLEINRHHRYMDFEARFVECVNSHTGLGIDEFADFYVTYVGENIEVYDRCGDETGIFIIYEDLWASIIEDLRQRDEEVDALLSDEHGELYASGEGLEASLKMFAMLRSERLASAAPGPEIDPQVETWLGEVRDLTLWTIGNNEALRGCEEEHGKETMRDATGCAKRGFQRAVRGYQGRNSRRSLTGRCGAADGTVPRRFQQTRGALRHRAAFL